MTFIKSFANMFDRIFLALIEAMNGNVLSAAGLMFLIVVGWACTVVILWLFLYDWLFQKVENITRDWWDRKSS